MPTSVIALEILLILLPGFAAAYIVRRLAVRGQQTDLEQITEALLFSFVIYWIYRIWTGTSLPFAFDITKDGAVLNFRNPQIGKLVFLSAVVGFAMVAYVNLDGGRIFRKLKLTERTSRDSIWNDVFQDVGSIAQVELKDGRSVIGVVDYYSDSAADSSVFLKNAAWVVSKDGSSTTTPIEGPGILLTKEAQIVSVSFLDKGKDVAE